MNQKGFVNMAVIILVVVLVGALGYVTLIRNLEKPVQQPPVSTAPSLTPTPPAKTPSPSSQENNSVHPQLELQVNFKKASKLLGDLDSAWGYNGRFVNKLPSDIYLQGVDFEFLPKGVASKDLPQFTINTWYPRFLYDQPSPYPNFDKYAQSQPTTLIRQEDLSNGTIRYKLVQPLIIPSEDKKSDKKNSTFLVLTADRWPDSISEIRIVGVRVNTSDNKSAGAKLVIGFPDFPDMVSRAVDYIAFYKDRTWFPDRDWIDNGKQ